MKDYVIGVKLKGQNVVLKEVNAIKKAGEKLAKTNFTAKVGSSGGRASFAGVRNEINARKQLEREKRNADATRGVREMEKRNAQANKNRLATVSSGVGHASGGLQNAMTGGTSGVTASLPGIGSIFAASENSIQQAAQMFVQGVTASKNIKLVEANFGRAFGNSMQGAFRGTAFEFQNSGNANRATQATLATLAEQGVSTSLLSNKENIDILSKTMQAQGVSSLDELLQRAQSGQLKEGGGLGKGEIEYAKSLSALLNNRYSANIGAEGLLKLFKSKGGAISASAGSGDLPGLAAAVRKEQEIRDREENFSAGAAGYESAYNTGLANRIADRADTMRFQRVARFINRGVRYATREANHAAEQGGRVLSGDFEGARNAAINHSQQAQLDRLNEMRARVGRRPLTLEEMGGTAAPEGGGADEGGSASGGAAPLSQSNADLTRAGASLAATLSAINNQLMAIQYQMRTRGG